MKVYADKKSYVKDSGLQIGDTVLVKSSPMMRKSDTPFEKSPYRVIAKKHSMITAENELGRKVTRNSSFFKKIPTTISNDDADVDSLPSYGDTNEMSQNNQTGDNIDERPPDENTTNPPPVVEITRPAREKRRPTWMKDFETN